VLKKIFNAQAHLSPWEKMTARYQQAAEKFNSDPTTRWETDHKHVKDRFFRLKDNFEKLDKTRRDKSGVEEELTPTETGDDGRGVPRAQAMDGRRAQGEDGH